ncbi:Segregation and condensation protein A [uncultured Desulfobacterium sp.]|uniref:Segregation and condensation protein A n=1 Tax=uncultured Desulfobacterium sp. TaxID=201089 RepID=A0A445MX90_9BACT|nr:Segregation and condensation protein A [uncultured Desulfobacterium sp.]
MEYEVKLEIFEGPLDLLLHLIHKNEVDIFDIPIATITDQYLEYIDMMKALNINIAADFLVMASTLTHIKSKMLLPGLKDDEEEDPMVELTQPLLEYMQFREAAEGLSERELLERDVFIRRSPVDMQDQLKGEESPLDVTLFQLMDAFKRIIEQELPGAKIEVHLEKWTINDKMEAIMTHLKEHGAAFFHEVFSKDRTISEFVVTFLALLELAHQGLIAVFQPTHTSDIQLIPQFDKAGEDGDDNR